VFATGFAPFRGGPLQYARERGIAEVVKRLNELANRYGERFSPDEGWSLITA
jgi:3-hydroxyacyl-CoA dehydrogenase / enoyl-CoA hydratase / 3-hydroxybutyryl-CoA epimerase